MKLNCNFLGEGRMQNKNLLWGEYGYFLELHISIIIVLIPYKSIHCTFGRTGTISASGITNDRNTVLMFMSATSEDVSNSSTDAELPFLKTLNDKQKLR